MTYYVPRLPNRRPGPVLQWSLRGLLALLLLAGPLAGWLWFRDWASVDWRELAYFLLVMASVVAPFLLVTSVMIRLGWEPPQQFALAMAGACAMVLAAVYFGYDLQSAAWYESMRVDSQTPNLAQTYAFPLAMAKTLAPISCAAGFVFGNVLARFR